MTPLPRLIVTGASGFIGRHLLEAVKEDYRIFGLARRSQARSGAPVHPNISWFQVDIGEREALERVLGQIRESGGADVLIHLAAHYDFTGDKHPFRQPTTITRSPRFWWRITGCDGFESQLSRAANSRRWLSRATDAITNSRSLSWGNGHHRPSNRGTVL